ncbi:DUF2855 family protein [Qipengyuania sp. GPGPB31]|uniref:DUF2855 family protein n=1 Tax=Qipengyuania sp. GPGPB31 TaxID=3023518 RepID=UPI000C493459|nr:hypothetical protein [Erythrobacteraceae bacterium]
MQQVHVRKNAIGEARLVDCDQGKLADDAVRLEIESFSVTANNVTYAVVGDGFGYWNFFPVQGAGTDGMGIVPMWGHARVIESNVSEISVGERVYGYLPMATHLDVVPGKLSASGFTDMAAHRQPMSPVYNSYSRLAADPEHDPAREGERMIFGPLFKTGFLIEYFMRSQDWFGAGQVILTSASSKTAMGLASTARHRSPDIRRIGLTSSGNVAFVKQSGLYDEVLAYDDVQALAGQPAVSVDFAGNARLLGAIHAHLGDALKYSCLVGATHIEERGGGAGDLPGPAPTLFFAPDHAVALFKDLGPQEAGRQMAESWRIFLADAGDSVTIERHAGLAAARDVFVRMAGGSVDPAKGIIIEP